MTTLDCAGISFRYGRRGPRVIQDLTWRCPSGVTILLGPNGAGKSTLMNLVASATIPDAGSISYDGMVLDRRRRDLRAWRQAVGWVPQQVNAIPGMTVREQVAYLGWLKGMTRRDAEARTPLALELVRLTAKADEKTASLSGGQTRRMGIAGALVHDSQLVILDEPTAGLDPSQRSSLRRVLQDMDHVSWLISTHQTEDLGMHDAQVCVMDSGAIVWQGPSTKFLALGSGASDEARAVSAYRSLVGDEE